MSKRNFNVLGGAAVIAAIGVASAIGAGGRSKEPAPREATVTGKVVDLQSYMTGKFTGDDHTRATQAAIRAGTPAAVVTEDGLVLIGQGQRGPMRALMPLAFKEADVKGMLYEKEGVRYIDMTAITKAKSEDGEEEAEHPEVEPPGYDPDGPPDE